MSSRQCFLRFGVWLLAITIVAPATWAAPRPKWIKLGDRPGDRMIAEYFRQETARLRDACLADVGSLSQWEQKRKVYHRQLLDMLGLDPLPKRTDLKAKVTGTIHRAGIVVEKLHFQSQPGLYVTANLYRPEKCTEPLPGILYVCGHGRVKIDGVSYGNKCHYQHHGIWFAQHGYVCLMIDSLQLGEIEGIHHGTYNHGMWWWNNRGYTPAGVEAWNCIRALDYLQSRPEVDPERLGVTGRSGGGAYSWWISSIDERIKVAVPVAGITDLENHVVDGCVEGHCDCMFIVNLYGWDYPLVAAMVAPRPLLIGNTDDDDIFPKNGVKRLLAKVRRVYSLYGAEQKLALVMPPGKHADLPELQKAAFQWFDKHLKGTDRPVDAAAEKLFTPQELKVFEELPADERNTQIQEQFVPIAPEPPVPEDRAAWDQLRQQWLARLQERTFRAWPQEPEPLEVQQAFEEQEQGIVLAAYDFTSQGPVRLRAYVLYESDSEPQSILFHVLDQEGWNDLVAALRCEFNDRIVADAKVDEEVKLPAADADRFGKLVDQVRQQRCALVFLPPRGIGPTAWNPSERKQTQIRRRFMLLGQTLDGMRIWDVRRAIQVVRSNDTAARLPLRLVGKGAAAGWALYAALFEAGIDRVELVDLPASHRDGPILLAVRRTLDVPQTVAMVAQRSRVVIRSNDAAPWKWPQAVAKRLGWKADAIVVKP